MLIFPPIMNMKKFFLLAVSVLIAGSGFAWSKKSENTGNLGRTYISVEGGASFNRYNNAGSKQDVTGATASLVVNAPIFKPGVNTFKKIGWLGLDGNLFFDYNYSGDYNNNALANTKKFLYNEGTIGVQLTPYLNFEFDFVFLKAIKPFAYGRFGYTLSRYSLDDGNTNPGYLSYGFGGGVEFVLLDSLSFTPVWKWYGNAKDGIPCYQTAGVELTYWFTDQFCAALFWSHNFGQRYADDFELQHGDIFGAKLKIGFLR